MKEAKVFGYSGRRFPPEPLGDWERDGNVMASDYKCICPLPNPKGLHLQMCVNYNARLRGKQEKREICRQCNSRPATTSYGMDWPVCEKCSQSMSR